MPIFQQNIKKDLQKLLKRDKLIIFGDKSRNMYSTNAKYYNKLMISCFTATYKKSDDNIIAKIDNKSKEIISSKYINLKNKRKT